jgi:hypothetical protein
VALRTHSQHKPVESNGRTSAQAARGGASIKRHYYYLLRHGGHAPEGAVPGELAVEVDLGLRVLVAVPLQHARVGRRDVSHLPDLCAGGRPQDVEDDVELMVFFRLRRQATTNRRRSDGR